MVKKIVLKNNIITFQVQVSSDKKIFSDKNKVSNVIEKSNIQSTLEKLKFNENCKSILKENKADLQVSFCR